MDNEGWIKQAYKYIYEHCAFSDVSGIVPGKNGSIISASVSINLPSKFIETGITNKGIRTKETVKFIFQENFPLIAPKIVLRDDFPRDFPHINPSSDEVLPCIYAGDLSELLQQPKWMNGILDQLVDWLETAASDSLLNYEYGWEPMRNDDCRGFIVYNDYEILESLDKKTNIPGKYKSIHYSENQNIIFAGNQILSQKSKNAQLLFFLTPKVINFYVPNSIKVFDDLCLYAESIGLSNIRVSIEDIDAKFYDEEKIFVTFLIKRPCRIIGSDLEIEFLNFVINKCKKRKGKKRVLPECNVEMLAHINDKSTLLLKKLSGTVNTYKDNNKSITFLGCGSLGSKIALHLARNGNDNFLCVDYDYFLPHNNARHALLFSDYSSKAYFLSFAIKNIGNSNAIFENELAFDIDYSKSGLVIDTTSSFSVRNFLLANKKLPPVISAGLYNSGKIGLLFIESMDTSCKLLHEWAFIYQQAIINENIRDVLFNDKIENVNIGQSCSSQTMIASDAQISLMASAMSIKIQEIISNNFNIKPEINLYIYQEYNLNVKIINIPEFLKLPSFNGWDLYISSEISDLMLKCLISKKPNETGGVLLGTVFEYAKTIVITSLLSAPSDSIEKRNMFVLGTIGLYKKIQKIETRTSGKVTYLGTWHTHPCGGEASSIDKKTLEKLLSTRNYEPTVCLIRTPSEIILV